MTRQKPPHSGRGSGLLRRVQLFAYSATRGGARMKIVIGALAAALVVGISYGQPAQAQGAPPGPYGQPAQAQGAPPGPYGQPAQAQGAPPGPYGQPARAQGTPPGSYLHSCSRVRLEGGPLVAASRRANRGG